MASISAALGEPVEENCSKAAAKPGADPEQIVMVSFLMIRSAGLAGSGHDNLVLEVRLHALSSVGDA